MAHFHLEYEGPLPANMQAVECKKVKHQIRSAFDGQISAWLDHYPDFVDPTFHGDNFKWLEEDEEDYLFCPLVSSRLHMVCELEILFFRREPPGALITKPRDIYGGDLDNRLKVLFDALRVPASLDEMPKALGKLKRPFFCLLEDDSLITKFQVTSTPLLRAAKPGCEKDVRLIIGVTIGLTRRTSENRVFLV